MSQSKESYLIKQARRIILESLNITYPHPLLVRNLFHTVITVNPVYVDDMLQKDLYYLKDKGYVLINDRVGFSDILPFEKRLVRLTAPGKEIAERTMTDPALEI